MTIEPTDRSIALRRRYGALVLAMAVIASVWVLSSERAGAATVTVNATNFLFTPADITVNVGDTVRWVNGDAESHAVQGGSLASPEIISGESFSHTFTEPEQLTYTCRFHTYMVGTINVVAGQEAPPPAPAAPAAGGAATTAPAAEAAPTTTAPTTTTTAAPRFQDVPDDPEARTPPAGDARHLATPNAPAATNPPSSSSAPPTTAAPRGSTFQDVPPDHTAEHAPGDVVTAQAVGQAVGADVEDGPSPPAAGDQGDGTVLAPFNEVEGVKVFHLTLDETEIEVSPGVVKPAYAINGTVPAPTIKVDEGDRVRIVVNNQLPFPTSTHWHGMILPNDQDGVGGITQPHIEPGTEYTYEWTAVATGTHWYHAHSSGRHIGKGLYGALIVVPDEGDIEADRDYTLLLGDTDLGFTINGRSFPSTPTLMTEVGDRVRLRVINTGDQVHAFHLHGVPFGVMAQDGLPKPRPEQMDTLTISPGQSFDLLFAQRYPGDWVIHCHMFIHSHMSGDTHAPGESGMNGMTALVRATGEPLTDEKAAAAEPVEVAGAPLGAKQGSDDEGFVIFVAVVSVLLACGLLQRTRLRFPPFS